MFKIFKSDNVHPNLNAIHDVYQTKNTFYIIT